MSVLAVTHKPFTSILVYVDDDGAVIVYVSSIYVSTTITNVS